MGARGVAVAVSFMAAVAGAGVVSASATGSSATSSSATTAELASRVEHHPHGPTTSDIKRAFDPVRAAPPTDRVLFTNGPVSCFTMPPQGAMGLHYVIPALVGDGKIDARTPEALIYEPQVDGAKQLVGLEYLVLKADWDKSHRAPPHLFGRTFDQVKAPNMFGLPDNYSLHVWLWQENPNGLFNPWNPFVHCPPVAHEHPMTN